LRYNAFNFANKGRISSMYYRFIMLDQWFPTGVPRYPGVPFTVARGAAG